MNSKKIISVLLALTLVISAIIPISVTAATTPKITVQSTSAVAGTTVDIDVSIENNPGILGAKLTFSFDNGLTLTKAVSGDAFSPLTYTKPGKFESPCNFVWDGQEIDVSDIKNGTILTLTFKIADSVKAGSELHINASCGTNGIVDTRLKPVTAQIINGGISVIDYIPGDVNNDTEVNSTDTIMVRRDMAGGYDQVINKLAADVDANGEIGISDVISLRRSIAGGYGVVLLPGKVSADVCAHNMEEIPYKAATSTENGNIQYWHCTKCDKYYSDTEGVHIISLSDTIIPKIDGVFHNISYDISNGDSYLSSQQIQNPNPLYYIESDGLALKNLSVSGYRFLGWYDGAGINADQVKRIPAGAKDDYELYAHWEKIPYSVQLKSDVFIDTNTLSYTVDTGVTLPTPKLSNYIFTGWSDENGHLYRSTKIPPGTTGNIILTANWTSERNKTWAKTKLDAPIIVENGNDILFAYEIGQIQNVPLYTIKDFGYISGEGITKSSTETYSTKIDNSLMEAFTKTASNATTDSSNWSLSSSWNDTTSVNEQWVKETGKEIGEVDVVAKNKENNWNVSSGRSGSTETTTLTTNNQGWENQAQINGNEGTSTTDGSVHKETDNKSWNINGKLTYTPKSFSLGLGFKGASASASSSGGFGGELGGGYEHSWSTEDEASHSETNTQNHGFELSGKQDVSETSTNSTVENSSWNSSQSYGGSSSTSQSKTNSVYLSEKISQAYGYGHEYAKGEEQSQQQGHSSTQSYEDGYSSSVTYSLSTQEEKTSSWTTQSTKPGYHRWIVAGTAHVFGVVGYNMLTKSYYTYTYSVMDDETHEFEDYSYTSAQYNDNENGVIPFEIPYEVAEYVAERTCFSDGLKVDLTSGIVTEYNGRDTCVVIPEYFNTGTGDVVKITGISSTAFQNNNNIEAVVLSDFITEIPENAFKNCTSLIGVSGGNITKIGANAFNGCISAKECGVSSQIEFLGEHAFDGVGALVVNAANADVVQAAANSGANEIVICLEYIEDICDLENTEVIVPEDTLYFEINGNKDTTYDISLKSDATVTSINKLNIDNTAKLPINISSSEIALNQVSMHSDGLSAVFSAESANVGLQGTVSLISNNENALLCKQIKLFESNDNVVGNLAVSKNILACSEIINSSLMTGNVILIDDGDFDNYLNSRNILFDANYGNCSIETKTVPYLNSFGELPIPSRDYYTFDGWYTEAEGGEEVTEDTIMTSFTDITLYAHWTHNSVSAWTLASKVPDDAEIVDRKYNYTLTSYTTSSSSSLSGWEKYNSSWVWSSYGGWSGWQDSWIGSSDSRDVQTQSVISGYNTKHQWLFHRWYGKSGGSYLACAYRSGVCLTYEETGWLDYPLEWQDSHYFGGEAYDAYSKGAINGRPIYWYWTAERDVEDYNSPIYKTQYRYRDRSKIYTYYYKKAESKESPTYPTGDNISNIQEWVQYRTK